MGKKSKIVPALKADLLGLKNRRVPTPVISVFMLFPVPNIPVTKNPSSPCIRTAPSVAFIVLPNPLPP